MTASATALTPIDAVDQALAAIEPYDRADLAARLGQARTRLCTEQVRVLIVGEFKQGKSMLVNGLVGLPVCPVFDDVATSVPTVVRHAETPTAHLVRVLDHDGEGGEPRLHRVEVAVEELAEHVSESGNPGNGKRLSYAEVGLPLELLAEGLELVDTPGVGGLHSVHGAATLAALPSADAVLLVSDASQEYTRPELDFLRHAIRICPNVACVITKTDLYPEWRRIVELDRGHLQAANIGADMFPVSSTLRLHAVRTADPELNAESGFAALVGFLRRGVLGQADLLARRSTVHDVMTVTDQILDTLRTEQRAQRDPDGLQELLRELTAAQERAAALKERSARWQITLNDGVADLNADIDHDLRDRLREVVRVGEEEIENTGDPTKKWESFATWVEQQVAAAASTNSLWAAERARWLAQQVADHFAEEQGKVLPRLRTEASDALGAVRQMTISEGEPWHLGQQALTGLRGGYIGVLMFGLMGTLVGMSLLNPFSIGAGLLLGGKTISDERRRIIQRRQNEGKAALRRYVDDATFQVGKDSRDVLRGVQRTLRDHFTELAEQMNRSLKESQAAAERSVKTSKADRERRLGEIGEQIERLSVLRQQVRTLLTAADLPAVAADQPPAAPPAIAPAAAGGRQSQEAPSRETPSRETPSRETTEEPAR
ncbi:MAG TPA: dynamin family protein [Egibacteraceae bacterium]|nr:dynamin family protein [Egibacteraceae bacterium]